MEYLFAVVTLVAIYAVAAVGLNLAFGLAGMFVLTQGAFLGIGAYTAGIMAKTLPFGFWPGLALAAVLAAFLAWLIAQITIRIPGEAFIVSSIGVQLVIVDIFYNLKGVTGGANGLTNLPNIMPNGFTFMLTAIAVLIVVAIYANRVSRSASGRVLRAIRDDETAAWSTGKNVIKVKVQVYMLCCALGAIAGGFLGVYSKYVHPASFTLHHSILLIAMIVAGGLGSVRGAVLGAFLVVGLPELLRFLPVTANYILQIQQVVYGLILILVPFIRPRGLLPDTYTLRHSLAKEQSPTVSKQSQRSRPS